MTNNNQHTKDVHYCCCSCFGFFHQVELISCGLLLINLPVIVILAVSVFPVSFPAPQRFLVQL